MLGCYYSFWVQNKVSGIESFPQRPSPSVLSGCPLIGIYHTLIGLNMWFLTYICPLYTTRSKGSIFSKPQLLFKVNKVRLVCLQLIHPIPASLIFKSYPASCFLFQAFLDIQTLAFCSELGLLSLSSLFLREVSGRVAFALGPDPQTTVKEWLVCFEEMVNGGLKEGRNREESYCNLPSRYYEIRYNVDWFSPFKNKITSQKQSLRKLDKPNSCMNT